MNSAELSNEARPAMARCQGTTRAGRPCQARPARGSRFCPAHEATPSAKPRRLASIDDVITDLLAKQERLSGLVDGAEELGELIKLFAAHSQNATRLGRLLRDRQVLAGKQAGELLGVIDQALDELGRELGLEL